MKLRDPNGEIVDADRVKVEQADDPWLIYTLEDGAVLRIKLIVSAVFKVHDRWTPEGDPVYIARTQNVVAIDVPDELKNL